ncbi:hypothetical protein F511_28362 [Dorcoceras hygrometricum]|uniref:Acyl-CoA dehydrogenase-related protein n=1 Tax=Dorcoceras hygrometricum TaxID=472368 RepID=A0A2Z7B2G5_9LAMI|nr:hypothetical protein F511_28362 [Dorcoceras hygrometricum]
MSLFDLQDVCIAIGSLATLDLSMIVDLIGIYGLKGPYCTLTTTDWFLQALSVIPRGSWGDVARRFIMIRWASPELSKKKIGKRVAGPPPCAATTTSHARDTIARWSRDGEPHVARWPRDLCTVAGRTCLEWPLLCAKLAGRGSLSVAHWSRIHGDAPCATLADHCRCCCATTPRAGRATAAQEAAEEALLVERKAPHVGRAMRDCAALVARKIRWWSAAAGRPPLRRRSGDVVTAGLNSYRFWFEPVPGSP